jgi:hypothetical protein
MVTIDLTMFKSPWDFRNRLCRQIASKCGKKQFDPAVEPYVVFELVFFITLKGKTKMLFPTRYYLYPFIYDDAGFPKLFFRMINRYIFELTLTIRIMKKEDQVL